MSCSSCRPSSASTPDWRGSALGWAGPARSPGWRPSSASSPACSSRWRCCPRSGAGRARPQAYYEELVASTRRRRRTARAGAPTRSSATSRSGSPRRAASGRSACPTNRRPTSLDLAGTFGARLLDPDGPASTRTGRRTSRPASTAPRASRRSTSGRRPRAPTTCWPRRPSMSSTARRAAPERPLYSGPTRGPGGSPFRTRRAHERDGIRRALIDVGAGPIDGRPERPRGSSSSTTTPCSVPASPASSRGNRTWKSSARRTMPAARSTEPSRRRRTSS